MAHGPLSDYLDYPPHGSLLLTSTSGWHANGPPSSLHRAAREATSGDAGRDRGGVASEASAIARGRRRARTARRRVPERGSGLQTPVANETAGSKRRSSVDFIAGADEKKPKADTWR